MTIPVCCNRLTCRVSNFSLVNIRLARLFIVVLTKCGVGKFLENPSGYVTRVRAELLACGIRAISVCVRNRGRRNVLLMSRIGLIYVLMLVNNVYNLVKLRPLNLTSSLPPNVRRRLGPADKFRVVSLG